MARLDGTPWLVCALLYDGGLRLLEALQLRVKDIDLERREITVCRGKGQKDRRTVLPAVLVERLRSHLTAVRARHDLDISLALLIEILPSPSLLRPPPVVRQHAILPRTFPDGDDDGQWAWQQRPAIVHHAAMFDLILSILRAHLSAGEWHPGRVSQPVADRHQTAALMARNARAV